jgi:hypothetical protein
MTWQWYYASTWLTCTPENQLKLTKREQEPSVEPIRLSNDVGEIFGHPENDLLHFRLFGDDQDMRTFVRKGPKSGDAPIYAVIQRSLREFLPYDAGRKLFRNGKPYRVRKEICIGTEHYVADNGHLFKMLDGEFVPVHWKRTDLSRAQLLNMTSTRYKWEFKGAFRLERMRAAVSKVSEQMEDSETAQTLKDAFEQFDPNFDVTEHGPYQFNDFLVARGLHELAIKVMETYHADAPTNWQSFDAMTNARIEKARAEGRPMANIMVRGHQYVIIFDSGSGASGQPPVVIRPLRYERILTSIEENYGRSHIKLLYDALLELGCNPRIFLMAAMANENCIDEFIPEEHRERIRGLVRGGSMGTALQNQLPPLLEKYKECEIRLSSEERLKPKPLESIVKKTLTTGFRVPEQLREHCPTFENMIHHIRNNQCWLLGTGQQTCDLCSTKNVVLNHCGTSKACLKCWVDSLYSDSMRCPFCRQEVDDAQLSIVTGVSKCKKAPCKKRKRERSFSTAEEVLQEIHKDTLYAHFKLEDSQPMRKWFTVLMRRGMLKNGQLPRNMQAKKSLRSALQEFNILN